MFIFSGEVNGGGGFFYGEVNDLLRVFRPLCGQVVLHALKWAGLNNKITEREPTSSKVFV